MHSHLDALQLSMAKPVVSESGRQRVIREKKKYVHAFLEGWLITSAELTHKGEAPVRYNPYHGPEFLREGKVVKHLSVAHLKPDGQVLGVA